MATRASSDRASGSRTATVDMSCWRRSPSARPHAVPRPRGAARRQPARMNDTAFLRSDEPPGGVALGTSRRTGCRPTSSTSRSEGPGTAASTRRRRTSALCGRPCSRAASSRRIWSPRWFVPTAMCRAIHPGGTGWGSWLARTGDVVELHGYDAGVSFRTVHDPHDRLTHTVLSSTSEGLGRLRALDELILPGL